MEMWEKHRAPKFVSEFCRRPHGTELQNGINPWKMWKCESLMQTLQSILFYGSDKYPVRLTCNFRSCAHLILRSFTSEILYLSVTWLHLYKEYLRLLLFLVFPEWINLPWNSIFNLLLTRYRFKTDSTLYISSPGLSVAVYPECLPLLGVWPWECPSLSPCLTGCRGK